MALTKADLTAIKHVVVEGVGEAIEDVVSPRLQRIETRLDAVETTLVKMNRRLDVFDVWQSNFRDLVKLLADKNVLTSEEAARLGVQLNRRAA